MKEKLQKLGKCDGECLLSDECILKNEIIINTKQSRISLQERFEEYNGENLAKDFIWDDPKGKEII